MNWIGKRIKAIGKDTTLIINGVVTGVYEDRECLEVKLPDGTYRFINHNYFTIIEVGQPR